MNISMNQILDDATEKSYQLIAQVFMEGGGAKRGKANLREIFRQVYQDGATQERLNVTHRLKSWIDNVENGR